jgi:hypothetical protein
VAEAPQDYDRMTTFGVSDDFRVVKPVPTLPDVSQRLESGVT